MNAPVSLDEAARDSPFLTLVRVTRALATGWPEGSITFPVIVPVTVIWARSSPQKAITKVKNRQTLCSFVFNTGFTSGRCNYSVENVVVALSGIGIDSIPGEELVSRAPALKNVYLAIKKPCSRRPATMDHAFRRIVKSSAVCFNGSYTARPQNTNNALRTSHWNRDSDARWDRRFRQPERPLDQ